MLKDKEWWQGQVLSPDFSLSSPAHLPVSHRVSHPGWSSNIPEWPMIWKTPPPPSGVLVTWLLVSDLILAFFIFIQTGKGKSNLSKLKWNKEWATKRYLTEELASLTWNGFSWPRTRQTPLKSIKQINTLSNALKTPLTNSWCLSLAYSRRGIPNPRSRGRS